MSVVQVICMPIQHFFSLAYLDFSYGGKRWQYKLICYDDGVPLCLKFQLSNVNAWLQTLELNIPSTI